MSDAPFRRALVIKLRHHGDVLLTGPVFSTLAEAHPGIEIDALVYSDTQEMLTLHPHVRTVHTIGRDWRKLGPLAQLSRYWGLYKALKSRDYDLIVHLTDHWHGARLARLLKPRVSVAPSVKKNSARASKTWAKSFTARYPVVGGNRRHTVDIHLDALRRIGIQPSEASKPLRFVAGDAAEASVAAKLEGQGVASGGYILIHPTSRWLFKTWPVAHVATLVDALTARGDTVVLSAAPSKAELDWIAQLKMKLARPVADLSGQLSLKELGALIAGARAFVGVDSVPMHLAAATQTPAVALFGPSGDIEWGPWRSPHRLITEPFSCRPCGQDGCGGSKVSDCLTAITPERVLAELDGLLAETGRGVSR
ncbi:putative lipopolysaccharide heptosyltransferase III [Jeongeupia naejangsanensis]|uniref:Lipopolysaccharide heptosyltransferase III n=1 Tax=Jeongeupia naejangsanensis TaxID=613195 RepID=A0ABS2BLP4_9NEIS|nr:putative lipopolysaccharide heptosyltransferase III [Jeongeupia naejangsanensis]MBM3116529.1 putative lipopolysaccharide heptosyltransferase III [Jeongeupia naejangsanensis]